MAGDVTTTGRKLNRTVAMRVSDEHAIVMDSLRVTFPENSVGVAFRWLLDQPEVREVVRRRVSGDQP